MDLEPSGEVLLLIFVYPLHNFSKFLWFTSLYFWKLSAWQHKLFPVCIAATWLHQFTQQIYSCQVFCDLAALHQGFERLCDRVTSWNIWPSATLLAFPPFSLSPIHLHFSQTQINSQILSFSFTDYSVITQAPQGLTCFPTTLKSNSFNHIQCSPQKNIWQIMGSFKAIRVMSFSSYPANLLFFFQLVFLFKNN